MFIGTFKATFARQSYYINKDHYKKWACMKEIKNKYVLYMRWPDRLPKDKHPNGHDLWFDRLVYIHSEGNYDETNRNYNHVYTTPDDRNIADLSVTVNGVFITEDRILTSQNPLYEKIRYHFTRHFTSVCYLKGRNINASDNDHVFYQVESVPILCARAVFTGYSHLANLHKISGLYHTPVHDLMVIRIERPVSAFLDTNLPLEAYLQPDTQGQYVPCGPIQTILANKSDMLIVEDMKFAMMGHILNTDTLKSSRDTFVDWFYPGESVMADCDEWIPREWGHFICLNNVHNLPRLASGAMLYSDEKLFGVGSFMLHKGDASMLAFTDVRKYEDIIFQACTDYDRYYEYINSPNGPWRPGR